MDVAIIDNSQLPSVLRNMFHCPTCRFWYSLDDKGPNGYCRPCYWGLQPDMKATIKRKAVVLDMAEVVDSDKSGQHAG